MRCAFKLRVQEFIGTCIWSVSLSCGNWCIISIPYVQDAILNLHNPCIRNATALLDNTLIDLCLAYVCYLCIQLIWSCWVWPLMSLTSPLWGKSSSPTKRNHVKYATRKVCVKELFSACWLLYLVCICHCALFATLGHAMEDCTGEMRVKKGKVCVLCCLI